MHVPPRLLRPPPPQEPSAERCLRLVQAPPPSLWPGRSVFQNTGFSILFFMDGKRDSVHCCAGLFLKINLITASLQALCVSISAKQESEKRSRAEGCAAGARSLRPCGEGVCGQVGGAAPGFRAVGHSGQVAGAGGEEPSGEVVRGVSSGLGGLHVKCEPLGCSPSLGVGSLEGGWQPLQGPWAPEVRDQNREKERQVLGATQVPPVTVPTSVSAPAPEAPCAPLVSAFGAPARGVQSPSQCPGPAPPTQ